MPRRSRASTPPSNAQDERWMQHAIAQARRGLGRTRPNPAVGAAVVRDGRVLGLGYHHGAGLPHAEVEALRVAVGDVRGATIYVTLEPCDHHGRTGPCTERLIAAGVARVVVGCIDPNHRVNHRGVAKLRRHGIQVDVGVCEDDCRELIAGYSKHVVQGLPLVLLKAAVSVDGRLATRTGDSRGLSGPESQAHLHRLRARCDAIVVGIGTVLADNPRLTPRGEEREAEDGNPLIRVVLDTQARTPPSSQVVRGPGTCIVAVGKGAAASRLRRLEQAGAEILRCPLRGGHVSLRHVLRTLGRRGLMTVLVEGGGTVHGSLLRQGLADRVLLYMTPRLIGGDGVPVLAGPGRRLIAETGLQEPRWQALGEDMLLTARL
ncbi:MAG: bifunctional diaminohydroxyphosphoribosylaminopyrimidine deaminase/5-amino-6-(5-phosphoribosylamino)uracil reductase RibD [Pseudomonadota bacterium]